MVRFGYRAPKTLADLSRILAEDPGARIIAGGTDVLVGIRIGRMRPTVLVDLKNLEDLKFIRNGGGKRPGLALGARTTMAEIEDSPLVRGPFASLAQAARLVGSRQIRNTATIGGNMCNASPAADTAPPLLTMEAEAIIDGPGGKRAVPLAEFFQGPGQTALQRGEILAEIRVPPTSVATRTIYLRHVTRMTVDIAIVAVAALLEVEGSLCVRARVALGAVAPTPIRVPAVEAFLEGKHLPNEAVIEKAAQMVAEASRPISDVRGSAEFRRKMVHVYTRRALRALTAGGDFPGPGGAA